MRRPALLCCAIATSTFLAGCTGTGVFFDHTFSWFGNNPNAPAGNSEMLLRLRGEPVSITPLQPEEGNVWPGPQKPDPTLQELEAEQQKAGAGAPTVAGGGTGHQQPRGAGTPPNGASNTGPNGVVAPPQSAGAGRSVDTTAGIKVPGYRDLQPVPPRGKGILVPNGNGTSTLIGPDGSISTVPTKP